MNLLVKIGEAVKVRESGKLADSRKLFELLLKNVDPNNPEYVRLMGEYVIQLRLESKEMASEALKLGQELMTKHPSEPAAIRALAHSLTDLGGFELAEPFFHKMINSYADNSLKKGEEQAHLAYVYLRIGKVASALELIDESIGNIEKNTANEDYVEIRESYAYFVKSLVERAVGKTVNAKQSAVKAMEIAKRGKAVFRINQARELIKLFESE